MTALTTTKKEPAAPWPSTPAQKPGHPRHAAYQGDDEGKIGLNGDEVGKAVLSRGPVVPDDLEGDRPEPHDHHQYPYRQQQGHQYPGHFGHGSRSPQGQQGTQQHAGQAQDRVDAAWQLYPQQGCQAHHGGGKQVGAHGIPGVVDQNDDRRHHHDAPAAEHRPQPDPDVDAVTYR